MSPNHILVDEKVSERGGHVVRVDALHPHPRMVVSVQHTSSSITAIFHHWIQFCVATKAKLC